MGLPSEIGKPGLMEAMLAKALLHKFELFCIELLLLISLVN